ncbi:MAG: tRNA (adenosine(37)-N6)-threonylcarbamoyltransferase complex transferase subunit TsaD [Candidatus Margulisiibacteriota bacterium]
MKILAIETSCDETSAAIVKDGREVLSNVVASQIEFHKKYGGVVPEIAARKHTEVINAVIQEAVEQAFLPKCSARSKKKLRRPPAVLFKKIDAVAVTYGPGLVGALLVGICAAKAIAYTLKVPLIGINHLEGHIYASNLGRDWSIQTRFPFICLIVSGGHTMIVEVKGHGKYIILGRTRDDAAGEAFDKVARLLKLGYPGGPIIDKLAQKGNPDAIRFTRPMLEDGYDFSFSGIKTAVVNYAAKMNNKIPRGRIPDIAASFQEAVVDVLVEKTIRAAREKKIKTVVLAGGVAANSRLRQKMLARAANAGITTIIPSLALCTDNAAMIGAAAYYHAKKKNFAKLDLAAAANLKLA